MEGDVGATGVSSEAQAVGDFFGPSDFLTIGEQLRTEWDGAIAELLGDEGGRLGQLAKLASPITYVNGGQPAYSYNSRNGDPASAN